MPIASIASSMFVVIGLLMITFVIFGLWVAAWLAFCFLYGTKQSRPGRQPDQDAPLQQAGRLALLPMTTDVAWHPQAERSLKRDEPIAQEV